MKKLERGSLDLSEIKRMGKRKIWGDSIGSKIYYHLNEKSYEFTLVGYNKDEQKATLLYNSKKYDIATNNIINRSFGNITGGCVKDFRYEINENITTIKKKCIILDRFRNEKGNKAYKCKCGECGNIRVVLEDYLMSRGFVCNVCSDKISYPERFFGALLNQLGVKYDYQKTFDWSKKIKLACDDKHVDKIYDFYIPSLNIIIEVNGTLHYKEGRWSKSRSLQYVKENDEGKKMLAQSNGVEMYIVINCMESSLEYIKSNILKSELAEIFNLKEIDWHKCDIDASTSLIKICSDLWNNGMRSTKEIAKEVGISKQTVITYLKKFSKIGLNDYNPKEELSNGARMTNKKNVKSVICLNDRKVFDSAADCVLFYRNLDIELNRSQIHSACNGTKKSHRGLQFKYIQDLTDEERLKYNTIQITN